MSDVLGAQGDCQWPLENGNSPQSRPRLQQPVPLRVMSYVLLTVQMLGLCSSLQFAADLCSALCWGHRPYSRQVTERMGCNVVIHPPPSIYPKAGNGALRDQWAIKYNSQNDSSTIAFTVRDLVHWNYVISQNIQRACKSWKSLLIYVFAAYIFFVHPTLSPLK